MKSCFWILAVALLTGCSPLLNDNVAREVAKIEQVSPEEIEVLEVLVGDGWSDGMDAHVRYRLCRGGKAEACAERSMLVGFSLQKSGYWKIIWYQRPGGEAMKPPQSRQAAPCAPSRIRRDRTAVR